jgi:hypothetical protein
MIIKQPIPGVPTILKKLGISKIGTFYLPLAYGDDAVWFFKDEPEFWGLDTNVSHSIATESYNKIDAKIFSVVDFDNALEVFGKIVKKPDASFIVYKSRFQEVPKINETLSKELETFEKGNHVIQLTSNGPDEHVSNHFDYEKFVKSLGSKKIPHKVGDGNSYVFIHKTDDMDEKMLRSETAVTNHHSFHTYCHYTQYNPDVKGVLEASKQIATTHLINLHDIMDKDGRRSCDYATGWDTMSLTQVQKLIEGVGFRQISYAELVENDKKYDVKITKLTKSSEIRDLKTGNFRWLIANS